MSHLYVMQNHYGFIKIGRSINVEARRKSLEKADGCSIAIVAVIDRAGDSEESIHIALDEHRLLGEWFDGDEEAKTAIVKAVGLNAEILWPYALAEDDIANGWLDLLSERRIATQIDKEFQRRIRDMQSRSGPTMPDTIRYDDSTIWTLIWRFEHQQNTIVSVSQRKNGQLILEGFREGTKKPETVPLYTSDLDAAMLIWPEEERPTLWEGTAWDCCVAGLKARKARIAAKNRAG